MNSEDIKKLANNLVTYSCRVQKGEKVLIEGSPLCLDLILALVDKIYDVGGYPFVNYGESRLSAHIMKGTTEEHIKLMEKYMHPIMEDMDAYIGISATNNIFELSNVSIINKNLYSKFYSQPIHSDIRVPKTKWVILKYPTFGFSQQAEMGIEEYSDFYFKVCNLDYSKMNLAMNNLKNLMEKTDKVRIVGKNTDITFSIKGLPAIICSGEANIPDGEVFTAPVKNSVNGIITYNTPSPYNGYIFENVSLTFKDGKIIKATCKENEDKLNEIFDTDKGSRYVGEFSFGLNPKIMNPIGDILYDEKIAGSIHFTPGSAYKECYNGNDSNIHWDMVLIQRSDYGGGEIYFDNKLIRKDGKFVLDELKNLNY